MPNLVRIKVDHEICVGSRICIAVAPMAFRLNADGQAIAEGEGEALNIIQTAVEACPVSAIALEWTDETEK